MNAGTDRVIYYALAFDEIHIRKQITFCKDSMTGFVNYGGILTKVSKEDKEATTALFIMASEINGSKKFPIGYVLLNGLDAQELSKIVQAFLIKMDEHGGRVLTITFDGLRANFSAMELLGANLNVESRDFQPFIFHPTSKHRIYLIPDPVHMFKLLRGTWEKFQVLFNEEGEVNKRKQRNKLINVDMFRNSAGSFFKNY